MLTTTIGAFPKPPYVPISDWFVKTGGDLTSAFLRRERSLAKLRNLAEAAAIE